EMPREIACRALRAAQGCGVPVILDPSPAHGLDDDLLRMTQYLTPNVTEAEILTGVRVRSAADGFQAGERLLARGAHVVLVKLGAGGCALTSGTTRVHVHAA